MIGREVGIVKNVSRSGFADSCPNWPVDKGEYEKWLRELGRPFPQTISGSLYSAGNTVYHS